MLETVYSGTNARALIDQQVSEDTPRGAGQGTPFPYIIHSSNAKPEEKQIHIDGERPPGARFADSADLITENTECMDLKLMSWNSLNVGLKIHRRNQNSY